MDFEDISVSIVDDAVGHVQLQRTAAKNALRNKTLKEIQTALQDFESNDAIRCVVISGHETVFAAGADIKEMSALNPISSLLNERAQYWKTIRNFSKPLIAAVNGYALGGGCELMMHCDIVIAGDNAAIGQPEINLGIIPGAGGTQRLVRTVGKPLAMKLVLSGELINAQQALSAGLITEVCAKEVTVSKALALAAKIASKSPLALRVAKQAILSSFEQSLEAGLELERQSFAILAASEDREEGIQAFLEKRKPQFTGK